MRIEIANGTFKVFTDVEKSVVVETKDDEGKVIDSYAYGLGDGQITTDKFIANATVDGKLAYIAKVDTDDEKTVADLKKLYGKALIKAKKFEAAAVAKLADAKAKAEAEAVAIDELFA